MRMYIVGSDGFGRGGSLKPHKPPPDYVVVAHDDPRRSSCATPTQSRLYSRREHEALKCGPINAAHLEQAFI